MNFDHPKFSGETTVQNAITEVAAMMGENVRLRRGFLMSTPNGIVSTYLHTCPRPGTMISKFSPSHLRGHYYLHGHMCILYVMRCNYHILWWYFILAFCELKDLSQHWM